MTTVILDYGTGNLRSLTAACRHVGMDVSVAKTPEMAAWADALILPGVGAFSPAMSKLNPMAWAVMNHVWAGRPLLGICLGMQLLLDSSDEGVQGVRGLGLIPGTVRRLPESPAPIPRVGWLPVTPAAPWDQTPLDTTAPASRFYFAHSYACYPENPEDWLAVTPWGTYVDDRCRGEICAAVRRGNVMGVQFHPEKSGEAGLQVLRRFGAMVAGREEQAA